MPLIAFLVGLGEMAVWGLVLFLPIIALFAIVAVLALAFGVALNGAVGMGLAVLILPLVIFVPIMVFSYILPVIFNLSGQLSRALVLKESFAPKDAVEIVVLRRRKFLSIFGFGD